MGEAESLAASAAKFRRKKLNTLWVWIAYPWAFASRLKGLWGCSLLGNGDPRGATATVTKEHLA